jgi:hypothetical protein
MDSTANDDLPAEVLLIRRARQALGLSPEKIVKNLTRITMSSRNWRLIEDGRSAPDETIAHMAYVVAIDADQLAESRPEAAEILREIQRQGSRSELIDDREGDLARAERLLAEAHEALRRARGEMG